MYKQLVIIFLASILLGCKGKEVVTTIVKEEVNYYSNPILQGFYPDPSICKVDGKFYMVNSTFAYFPGIPIFESSDLVNWKQIGNVLDRPEQLNLDGLDVSRGVFAPGLRYYNGTFYLTCTIVEGKGNFIVTATDPSGPWSNPVWTPEITGIDPSPFFDKDGRSYIVYNSESPNNQPEYDGHRTIKLVEFDTKTLKVISDPEIIVDKGAKPEDKPIWIEGPHIYKENGYYYLMAAEGGTSEGHSEVIFRSKSVKGPYVSYENNPILTQRQLDQNRENPITSVGHADIIEDDNGNWYGVFLGCRPYDNDNHYNLGRETFMAPVKWENDWPVFDLEGDVVKRKHQTPNNVTKEDFAFKNSGEYTFKEDFNSEQLGFEWLFLRTPRTKWYDISEGSLNINTRPESVSNPENPSFIGYRQKHINGSVSAELNFTASSENEKAGLIAFQNDKHFYYVCKSIQDGNTVIQLFKSNGSNMQEIAVKELKDNKSITFKIESRGLHYNFLYSINNKDWVTLKDNVDARFLSTKEAGGFVGTIYGMYTTSLGKLSSNKAVFNWFQIENKD
tara:strand:- start:30 stop:1709 length:1680 start_codon:yes stop_codon:yes gene_type:complete